MWISGQKSVPTAAIWLTVQAVWHVLWWALLLGVLRGLGFAPSIRMFVLGAAIGWLIYWIVIRSREQRQCKPNA
jgi:hypothetical protein